MSGADAVIAGAGPTPRRILAFDGGGIRGLLSLALLEALEQRVGAPIRDHLDTIAGTSIGALLACAAAAGVSTSALRALVRERGPLIFPRPWPWAGLRRPKYSAAPLRSVLTEVFGAARFGALPRRVLVPVYDVAAHDAIVLDSTHPGHGALAIVDVCLASAAAQTYFPAVPLVLGTRRLVCVDGGTGVNNPALVAWVAEARRHPMARSLLISIGTGQRTRPVPEATATRAGAVAWLRNDLIGALLGAPADVVDDGCRSVVPPGRYFRLQTRLARAAHALDDASPANCARLEAEAAAYLAERGGDLVVDLAAESLLGMARMAEGSRTVEIGSR